jgi:hypothetical protein
MRAGKLISKRLILFLSLIDILTHLFDSLTTLFIFRSKLIDLRSIRLMQRNVRDNTRRKSIIRLWESISRMPTQQASERFTSELNIWKSPHPLSLGVAAPVYDSLPPIEKTSPIHTLTPERRSPVQKIDDILRSIFQFTHLYYAPS